MQWCATLPFALSELHPLSCCWCKDQYLFTGDSDFQLLACLWCQQVHHSTCLPQITCKDMGFFPLWAPGSAFITGCDGKGIVQSWSWPLTPSLGCTFLAREGQSSLPKEKMTLLLWVKRNQSFKIYLGKKRSEGFWLFTLPCSCEKEQFGFNFAVIGEYKLCEMWEKGFVERMQLFAQGVFPDAILLLAQSFAIGWGGNPLKTESTKWKGWKKQQVDVQNWQWVGCPWGRM